MSVTEILEAILQLTPEERHQIVATVRQMDRDDWFPGEDSLSSEEQYLVESRLANHQQQAGAVPCGAVMKNLSSRFLPCTTK